MCIEMYALTYVYMYMHALFNIQELWVGGRGSVVDYLLIIIAQ